MDDVTKDKPRTARPSEIRMSIQTGEAWVVDDSSKADDKVLIASITNDILRNAIYDCMAGFAKIQGWGGVLTAAQIRGRIVARCESFIKEAPVEG